MSNQLIYCILLLVFSVSNKAESQNKHFAYKLAGKTPNVFILASEYPGFSFIFPEMAGNLKLGIMVGDESKWLDSMNVKKVDYTARRINYQIEDPFLKGGSISFAAVRLDDTDGIILEISTTNIPDNTQLFWSYGGASGKMQEQEKDNLTLFPSNCKYNVFSVEHTAFTLYYGESMNLKTINAVMPVSSEIRLSDAHKQDSPLTFFESGKKTDAPALCGRLPLTNGEKEYFCIYKQNSKADYNHYMLPALFKKESELSNQDI